MKSGRKISVTLVATISVFALAACSENTHEMTASSDVALAEADVAAEVVSAPSAPESADIPVDEPQIAYTYRLGFDLPLDSIRQVQQSHVAMCEELGSNGCRVISMNQARDSDEYSSGNLHIAVSANKARDFAKKLETTTGEADGELVSSSLTGEDLSKQIVDTEARLRSRELLRDRLMQILASRNGTVGELVEAERAVAQVNQEIDQARSWLETMRTRVAFSEMTIRYEAGEVSAVSGSFGEPIEAAWNSLGTVLGSTIAFMMMAGTVLFPIIFLLLALRWVLHRFGYRLRFWKNGRREVPAAAEA